MATAPLAPVKPAPYEQAEAAQRFPISVYLTRMLEILAILARQAVRIAQRRLRHHPVHGPELLREAFEKLGGSFIKFGQILSLQIETLPREYCDALLSLLDSVPPFPADEVDKVFFEQFRALPKDLYARFDYQTFASASIGQVHRATLLEGAMAAVKVQRPGVRRVFERDNLLLRAFIKIVFFFRIRGLYFMRDPVYELSTWTQDELDYRREASYAKILGENAVNTPTERLPKVYWDLTTTRVLTMEFLEGPSVAAYLRMVEQNDQAQLASLRATGFVPAVFSSNVISNFLNDAFRFGVFHADLHPANLLIMPGNVVGYVDFGIVATLTPEARRKQLELTLAYSSGNAESIYEGFLNICIIGDDADLAGMRRKIAAMAGQWYEEPAIAGRVRFRVSVTKTMMDLLSAARRNGVLVDREMIKYIRSTILADGLVSRLAPDVDLAGVLRAVVEDYLGTEARRKIFSSGNALALLADLTLWLQAGPRGVLHSLHLLERRQLRVREDEGAQPREAPAHGLRLRALSAAGIWVALVLALGGDPRFWSVISVHSVLAAAFFLIWTSWLLRLLQRLARP